MQNFAAATNTINYLDTIRAISAGGRANLSTPLSSWNDKWPHDFVMFMDQIIHSNKMKRKDIIARSGLDPDYAYKLLNGRKKTRERDYILALCIGAKLNIQQTQHALICSGMLPLSESDIRSRIIIMGIQSSLSVYHINGHLEDQHLPMIRVSSDMPSAAVSDSFKWEPASDSTSQPPASGSSSSDNSDKKHTYTIHDIKVEESEKGPTDIFANDYIGTAIVTDEENTRYYLEFHYHFGDDGMQINTRTEEQHQQYLKSKSDGTEPETESMESFYSLIDTTSSEFFQCFLKIEDALRARFDQSLSEADDTKFYGMRCELALAVSNKSQQAVFIELYNDADPELKEYFQLIRYTDGRCIFTGSHESRFMELYMGDHYKAIYPDKKEHDCFFQADQKTINDAENRYKYYFKRTRYHLNLYLIQEYKGFGLDHDTLSREVLEYVTDLAKLHYYSNEYEDAWAYHLDAERFINNLSDPKERMIHSSLNYSNMRTTAEHLNKTDEAKRLRNQMLKIKKKALAQANELSPEEQNSIFSPICTMLYNDYVSLFNAGKETKAYSLLDELLDLAENHYGISDDHSFERMYLFLHQADRFGEENFPQAEKYYRKALKEVLTFHLDSDTSRCRIVCVLYNNYAALLRDCIGYQEAMFYYNRALEIFESARFAGYTFTEFDLSLIDHIGEIISQFYETNNCSIEKERLLRKLETLKDLSAEISAT